MKIPNTPIMYFKKMTILAVALSIFATACKKNKNDDADDDVCAESNRVESGSIISNRYIVAYSPAAVNGRTMTASGLMERSRQMLEHHAIPAAKVEAVFGGEPGGFIANLSSEEANDLKNDVSINAIEPDRVISLATCFTVAAPRLITWNIAKVGYGDGTGKTAWIIDSGIDMDHPDLTVDANRSRSFVTGVTSPDDGNGHGTHVAGIIGGKNNTFGVLGVASGATLVSLRVLDDEGNGTLSAVIQALGYINQNGKAGDVVNMSLGEEESSAILIQQVKNTAARGIYLAIAAGNDGQLANKYSPGNANGTNIYTVSAVDSLDRFANFSNYGNDVVDFAAPGVYILSTFSQGRYAYLSGTSMAAPHVAGLLLLRGARITTSGYAVNDPDGTPDPIAHY
ncbi:MAG TPA: S8 family serine peptidase [Chitinophagaceae bacterium]